MSTDQARAVAFNEAAPPDERRDAQAELQRGSMPRAMSDLLPRSDIQPVIDHILADLEDQAMAKAMGRGQVIPFPSVAARERRPGMQSVYLDDLQVNVQGDYYDKPGVFAFDSMRAMVDQTPILGAVLMTRIRQVQRFCHVNETGKGPGFKIALRERDDHPDDTDKSSMKALESFFTNSGWERKPRQRARLKRDALPALMAKLVRDSLTMDSAPIETEWKRDKSLGLDGMYAVDGATIRLCTEHGYHGDDEIFALQVVQGQIRAAYGYDDLIYVPRNPRTDVMVGGYGMGETELLIRVVTGLLNAFTYNTKFFDSNAIPKGMLHLTGNYDDRDITAFKRYWNGMVKGVNNAWALPVMVSKDQESKAAFERFGVEANEIMFAKWMTFLTSIICAIYSIAPDEINFESFTSGASSLSGDDTEEKLAASKDKGLRPLLNHYSDLFTDYVVGEFGDKYVFRWTGLDDQDAAQEWEAKKLVMSVDELRAQMNMDKAPADWGDAPLNPSLVGPWSQAKQAEQQQGMEDYGQPGAPGDAGPGEPGDAGDFGGQGAQGAPGAQGAQGGDFGQVPGGGAGGDPPDQVPDLERGGDGGMEKAFGLPVYTIGGE